MKTKYGHVDFKNRDEHAEGLLIGLLLGIGIGACGALLFAPKPGKAIREKIKDVAGKKFNNLDKQWDNVKDKATDAASDAQDALESAGDKAESKLDQFANKAENEISDGVENVADKFRKQY